MTEMALVWTAYMQYLLQLRSFSPDEVEKIVRYSPERYVDSVTGRLITVGKLHEVLVLIPYERKEDALIPVTIHVTTRQQINVRLQTGRFRYE